MEYANFSVMLSIANEWRLPYYVGNVLKLRLSRDEDLMEVKVMRTFQPVTLASVMVVEILSTPSATCNLKQGDTAVLKVYDRRFNRVALDMYNLPACSQELENEYATDLIWNPPYQDWHPLYDPDCLGIQETDTSAVTEPTETRTTPEDRETNNSASMENAGTPAASAQEGLRQEVEDKVSSVEKQATEECHSRGTEKHGAEVQEEEGSAEDKAYPAEDDHDDEDPGAVWGTKPIRVRHTQYNSLLQATNERKLYEALQDLQSQGKVPQYFTALDLIPDTKITMNFATLRHSLSEKLTPANRKHITEYLRYPACLMSFVEGFRLDELAENAPREDWKRAVKVATEVINDLGDYPVLHDDVRPENIIMQKSVDAEGKNQYKAVVIDFANGRRRREDESDDEWREVKRYYHEESGLGGVMYKVLGLGKFQSTMRGDLRWRDDVVKSETQDDDEQGILAPAVAVTEQAITSATATCRISIS